MQNIEKNLSNIKHQIGDICQHFQRADGDVTLLAVSKRKPASDIRAAFEYGQRCFGENYLQEALEKISDLSDYDIEWHFIGAIQSNKTRPIAENFSWVHCVERLKVAQRLNDQRPTNLPPLNICIQVNIDQEATKAGVAIEAVEALAKAISSLPNIKLRGLMAIPARGETESEQRKPFAQLKECLTNLQSIGINCDTLSMGMSNDLEAAIAEGSTLVRIGTAIFGERL
ncbi:MAG: pyridoxal phosphate enzyme (YggS family) [Gammaproteobacteria bacterium]|jgi:pyridoxal phosphate enzyme (YggS family)